MCPCSLAWLETTSWNGPCLTSSIRCQVVPVRQHGTRASQESAPSHALSGNPRWTSLAKQFVQQMCPCPPVSNSLAAPLVPNPGVGLWILSWHLSCPALGFSLPPPSIDLGGFHGLPFVFGWVGHLFVAFWTRIYWIHFFPVWCPDISLGMIIKTQISERWEKDTAHYQGCRRRKL